ncbi:MAG TPA: T9SS type A sorting domain-containing protein [Bacteroidales bacterium]|nr:T9SS type A sorting domain-containing protein [Bacteroidales bacterium]
MKLFVVSILLCFFLVFDVLGQFPPPAGQPGSTAIYKDSSVFVAWASGCNIIRGWQHIADTSLGKAGAGDSSMAVGMAGANGVVSLGDGGVAVLTFDKPVLNGASWDFAVFENSFSDHFLELAFVEVSSDGIHYFRFPPVSLTDTLLQVGPYDSLDAEKINNLAGKYRAMYGTPFDLQELEGISGLDLNNITHIKIIDVVGSVDSGYASYDAYGHKVNDPWPTPFTTSGFDLDAVGVIHQALNAVPENVGKGDLTIFPNPVNDLLYISLNPGNQRSEISLWNIKGELINEIRSDRTLETINLSGLPPGIYILKISNTITTLQKKVIKY